MLAGRPAPHTVLQVHHERHPPQFDRSVGHLGQHHIDDYPVATANAVQHQLPVDRTGTHRHGADHHQHPVVRAARHISLQRTAVHLLLQRVSAHRGRGLSPGNDGTDRFGVFNADRFSGTVRGGVSSAEGPLFMHVREGKGLRYWHNHFLDSVQFAETVREQRQNGHV